MKKIILILGFFIVFASCEKEEPIQYSQIVKQTTYFDAVVSFSSEEVFGTVIANDTAKFKQFQEKTQIKVGDYIRVAKYDNVFRLVLN